MEQTSNRQIFIVEASKATIQRKPRVAGYARVSSDSDDQQNSFSAQVIHFSKIITSNDGWELADIYADEGISGISTEKRDDFNRMLDDCRKGKIDRILTKSISRFARNTFDTISLTRELKNLGISVFFEKENIDTGTLTSDNLLALYAMIAQEESLSLSKNVKKGKRMKMANGTILSSKAPYGYRVDNQQLSVYEPEALVIRRIFKEYLGGTGCHEIARKLTEDDIPRTDGQSKWTHGVVLYLLKNERYIGDTLLQKNYHRDEMPYKNCKNQGELPQYYIKNAHESIINESSFHMANSLLKKRSLVINANPYNDYLLSRKIKCDDCGTLYRRKQNRGISYWVCRTHDHNKQGCDSQILLEQDIYRTFIRLYHILKANWEEILLPIEVKMEQFSEVSAKGNVELKAINQKIAELHRQDHVISGLLSDGILDSAIFMSKSNALQQKLQTLKKEKQLLLNEQNTSGLLGATQMLIHTLKQGPDNMVSIEEEIFSDMVEEIVVADKNILHFKLTNGLILSERLE